MRKSQEYGSAKDSWRNIAILLIDPNRQRIADYFNSSAGVAFATGLHIRQRKRWRPELKRQTAVLFL
jgi:hypothetical protein